MTRKREVVPAGSEVVPAEVVPVVLPPKGGREPGTTETPRGRNQVPEPHNRNHLGGRRSPSGSASTSQQVNVRGNSRDPTRGSYCTPKWFADLLPTFDVDPFSNPRSHVRAAARCMLEDGGDGFGNGEAGTFVCGAPIASPERPGVIERLGNGLYRAIASALVWLQPDYQHVLRVIRHYAHTRWIALLRFDPRPEWFDAVYDHAELVGVIRGTPSGRVFNFESPPGVPSSSNSFPHAIYARRADDVPRALLPYLIAWRKKPA